MKATGIVRRIDDLGRIVIPKEIRRSFRIREGDSVEIFTDTQDRIVLRKYSSFGNLQETAALFTQLFAADGKQVLFCDTDQVLLAVGSDLQGVEGSVISAELRSLLTQRRSAELSGENRVALTANDGEQFSFQLVIPLVSGGDLLGGLLLLSHAEITPEERAQINIAARFIELQSQEV